MPTINAGASTAITVAVGTYLNGTGAGQAVIGAAGVFDPLTAGDAWQIGPFDRATVVSLTAIGAITYEVKDNMRDPSEADKLPVASVAAMQALVSVARNGSPIKGDLLHRFTDAAALTAVSGGVLANAPGVTFEGSQTVRFTSPSAGTTAGLQITGLSAPTRNSSFILLCYIPDYSKVQTIIPYMSQGATLTPNYVSFSGYSLTNDSHKYSGWHAIEVSQDMWTAT